MHGKCTHTHMMAAMPPLLDLWARLRRFGQVMAASSPRLPNKSTVMTCRWDTRGDDHRRVMAKSSAQCTRSARTPPKVHWIFRLGQTSALHTPPREAGDHSSTSVLGYQ